MKDPFNLFIDKAVEYTKINYYRLIDKTKILVFKCLHEKRSVEYFRKKANKIWSGISHKYMAQQIKQLEDMIGAYNSKGRKILNPSAEFKQIWQLEPESKFTGVENEYEKFVNKYYQTKLHTVSKEYVDTEAYLTKSLEKYDKSQEIIPYFNKNGSIHSHHNIASYLSMVHNTNLTKSGWNRSMYDSQLLDNDLFYLPAHPGACPLCAEAQGKVYSKSGKSKKYEPMDYAIEQGIGHPNCKHSWLLYWGKEQVQKDKYDNAKWTEYYQNDQKLKSLHRRRDSLKIDKTILKDLGNYGEIDNVNAKIRKINSHMKDLRIERSELKKILGFNGS